MKKRPRVAVLNTIEAAGAQVISDATEWGIVKTSAGLELLLGMFRTGNLKLTESFDPVAEVRQLVTVGADATQEVITAETRYKIEIGNPEDKYESHQRFPIVHAYTTPVALSGDADTDRLNVYSALASKVNAYPNNNVTAYVLTRHEFTLGGSVGDASTNFVPGETVTQQTSTETARVAKSLITSGTMAGDDAAGTIWVFDISDPDAWLDTAVTLTAAGASNCVVTQTNATQIDGAGLILEDDAGYYISSISRTGVNWVGATQGWTVAVAAAALAGIYSMGIGSTMAQLVPRYDQSKQEAITGYLEYELQAGDLFDTAKTYRKYVFNVLDGDENALSAEKEASIQTAILYVDFADGDLGDFDTAIQALT